MQILITYYLILKELYLQFKKYFPKFINKIFHFIKKRIFKYIIFILLILLFTGLVKLYNKRYELLIKHKAHNELFTIINSNENQMIIKEQLESYIFANLTEKLINDLLLFKGNSLNFNNDFIAVVITPHQEPSTAFINRNFDNKTIDPYKKEVQYHQKQRIKYINKNLKYNNIFYIDDYFINANKKEMKIYNNYKKEYNNFISIKRKNKEDLAHLGYGYFLIIKFLNNDNFYIFVSEGSNQINGFAERKKSKRRFEIYSLEAFKTTDYYRYLLFDVDNNDLFIKLDLMANE